MLLFFMGSFEKTYNSKLKEGERRKFWEREGIFKFRWELEKPLFLIDTPPPTLSGKMHIGHAFSYAQTDFIARYKRMRGFNVFYPFGTDDNGLATEKLVQKEMRVDLRKLSRKEAVEITCKYLDENRLEFVEDFKKVGLSCDFENLNYSTISPLSQKISQKTFIHLTDKGLVYRKKGPIPWDRVFQTTIAQAELEDKEVSGKLHYIKAKVKNSENTFIIYATTRPEMIFACLGFSIQDVGDYVKVKVDSEFWILGSSTYREVLEGDFEVIEKLRGEDLIGESVIIPLICREIEITHDVSIKADFGTGCAYFCSYGGVEDIEYVKRHNLTPYEILNNDGTLNNLCGEFSGLLASENGRSSVVRKLESLGVLVKSESITHSVNVGERSGAEVEYVSSTQWFVRYLDRKEYFFESVQKFNWYPSFMKHRLENWIKGLSWDWGFSRQRHFGIPIPVWYCEKCEEIVYAKLEQLPCDPTVTSPPIEMCPKCSCREFRAEKDVFDTWFTSASTPHISLQCVGDEKLKEKMFPFDLRPQAHDIINFWLFYTMAKSNLLYEKNPFRDVTISGWMLDSQGKKMSKSKGNVIAPQKLLEQYSADALRFLAASSKLGFDIPFQEKELRTGIKVVNKLYNAHKFFGLVLEDFEKDLDVLNAPSIDKWILAKLQDVIQNSVIAFENYDYEKAKSLFVGFFMRDVCDNYLEIVKQRLWQKKENFKFAQRTLYIVLFNCIRGLAPILPFICEEIYLIFYSKFESVDSVHLCEFPKLQEEFENSHLITLGDSFCEVVDAVRKFKGEKKMSLKDEISKIVVYSNSEIENFIRENIEDLKKACHFESVEFLRNEKFKVEIGN